MAAPALCRAFSQNAWRRDLCSNCFRSKEEHKAAAAARQKSPTDAARLAAASTVKSILKSNFRTSSNGIGKKSRIGVSFHKEESQVIGYGGDDEIHSADEGEEMEEVEPPNEEDLEKEKAEQQALERLTKANTDFNSVIANLQIENISQEKQISGKGVPSGIPVPGGRSAYTGPLRLGLGSKDNDGNKKTLLVSVRPFGSGGEEVSKPPVKTKIAVSNGLGSGVAVNGNSKELKDCSKTAVNGNMTNGFGYSSISSSKEISVKVSVSSNGVETKSTVINNGSSWRSSSTVSGSHMSKVNGSSDVLQVKNKMVNGYSKQSEMKVCETSLEAYSASDVNGGLPEVQAQNDNVNSATMTSKIGIPIPASRSIMPKEDGNQERFTLGFSQEDVQNGDKELSYPSNHSENGFEEVIQPKVCTVKEEIVNKTLDILKEEALKAHAEEPSPSPDLPLIIPNSNGETCGKSDVSRSDVQKNEQTPVPAERNIPSCKSFLLSEKKSLSESKAVHTENSVAKVQDEIEMSYEKLFKTEDTVLSTFKDSKLSTSVEMTTEKVKDTISNSLSEEHIFISEAKCNSSEILTSSQMTSSQSSNKCVKTKSTVTKQETIHSKSSEDAAVTAKKFSIIKASSNSTGAQKIPAVTKRPAPSILKMGVPTGWSSKSVSHKNLSPSLPESGGKGSSEEKISSERANIVNGILKTQPPTNTTAAPEKSLKPVNTIAKLRANFVNNNLKIIAESAAKIVNGTRYGNKNSLADEIPISKSSVMNLSMRPIPTNNIPNKSLTIEDNDLKGQAVKGLYNLEKSSNSRAKGIGPDIRELLRTPDKEKPEITFPNPILNKKNLVETKTSVENAEQLGDIKESHEDIKANVGDCDKSDSSKKEQDILNRPVLKDLATSQAAKIHERNEMVVESEESNKKFNEEAIPTISESYTNASVSFANAMESYCKEEIASNTMSHGAVLETNAEGKPVTSDQVEDLNVISQISEGTPLADSNVSIDEGSPKKESPNKGESAQEKPSPNDKNRKKGIVRRMLLKGGNEIYRKAGEMVRSVRRGNETRDETEIAKESEIQKEEREINIHNQVETAEVGISQKDLFLDQQSEMETCAKTTESEISVPAVVYVEEAINRAVSIQRQEFCPMVSFSSQEKAARVPPSMNDILISKDGNFSEQVKVPTALNAEYEKQINVLRSRPAFLGGGQPPIMSPRPSFLHSKLNTGQLWSSQSPSCNTVGSPTHDCNLPTASAASTRSERAASMSAISGPKGFLPPTGPRSRLSSLPATETDVRTTPAVNSPSLMQPTLRKPGPIISGVKPAIPAKPSKVLEASSVRQGGAIQQHNRPPGERKGSTSMGTPGSVGRSAGKRQAPKPPGMDASQRRESNSSESGYCLKEIDQKIGVEGIVSLVPTGNRLEGSETEKSNDNKAENCVEVNEEVQHNKVEGNERDVVLGKCELKQETECVEKSAYDHFQALGTNVEDLSPDDASSPPRGTHFVKNQALNASKSSSRVARETERRQMLLHMQSNQSRGPVPHPEDNSNLGTSSAPDPLLVMASNSLTPLSARQRSASLGRGVGVATPRPPLPGGSLGRAAGEGAAFSIAFTDLENVTPAATNPTNREEVPSALETPVVPSSNVINALTYELSNIENSEDRLRTNSPVRSRSEGSLAVHLAATPVDDSRMIPGSASLETPTGKVSMIRGQDTIGESPSSVSMSSKKKRHTVRGFLKFLRRGSLRDDACGIGGENREDANLESEPKARPVIVHPMELDGACVEVVKGGGVDVRRRLEEESAATSGSMTKIDESAGGTGCLVPREQSQNTPRRPTSIPLAPPRPPPVLHSPSSPSLSSSSSSSCGSTPVRPRPPPPPRGMAPVPPSPGGSGQKPARPPPPKPAHLLRLGLVDRGTPAGAAKSSGDGIYANLGEVRATLTPCKPQRTASMREVIPGPSGKAPGDAPTPRVTPRNLQISVSDIETCTSTGKISTSHSTGVASFHSDTSHALTSTSASKNTANSDVISCTETLVATKCDKLSWSVGAQVLPNLTAPGTSSAVSLSAAMSLSGTDSSSEEENAMAPPLPLVPPPSPPPPLPINPPPSPPSHPTSSSSSSSLASPLALPEDSGYESVEFHAVHESEVTGGRWWMEGGIAASRVSVVTTTTDSLEESYEAVVGANHRALADVLAQVCQPNPEEFGAYTPLRWSDFLVEGPKGGALRSMGPVTFHRAAMKGKGGLSGGDSWRRVTLGVHPRAASDLPQHFKGCACHEGGNAPVGRCTPALKSLCTFHDNVPNRFFSLEVGNASSDAPDLIQATVMVFNPLHLYSLKTYLIDLMSEKKTACRFPPLPEESNWCNRACLFLLVLLDTLCTLNWCSGEDELCVIREEARPGPAVIEGDGEVSDGSHPICPLPRLCVIPNVVCSRAESQSSPTLCFQSVVTQILDGIRGDAGMESFAHALQCVVGIQGSEDALVRSRSALELWLFGPPLLHNIAPHVSGERTQEELGEARDVSRWTTKNPILPLSETEPTSVEGELSHAAPRRWLDLERAGALRSLAVSALHRGGRIPSPLESGLDGSSGDEGVGLVGKCCRSWRVGEVAGNPSLPTCEEVRLRFLVGTSGVEVAEAWELLARSDCSSSTSANLVRTLADASSKKLASWNNTNEPGRGEALC